MTNKAEIEDKKQAKHKLNANKSKIKQDAKKIEFVLQKMKNEKR